MRVLCLVLTIVSECDTYKQSIYSITNSIKSEYHRKIKQACESVLIYLKNVYTQMRVLCLTMYSQLHLNVIPATAFTVLQYQK